MSDAWFGIAKNIENVKVPWKESHIVSVVEMEGQGGAQVRKQIVSAKLNILTVTITFKNCNVINSHKS